MAFRPWTGRERTPATRRRVRRVTTTCGEERTEARERRARRGKAARRDVDRDTVEVEVDRRAIRTAAPVSPAAWRANGVKAAPEPSETRACLATQLAVRRVKAVRLRVATSASL